jgi:hypothetical protein
VYKGKATPLEHRDRNNDKKKYKLEKSEQYFDQLMRMK